MCTLILITGFPATGKTSFAKYLSCKLNIPMVSKDAIKEHLFDTIGFKSRDDKISLGIAAMEIMYYFAEKCLETGQTVILENNFENISKTGLIKLIDKYKCRTITVYFHTDINVLTQRLMERDRSPGRHRGHVVNTQYPEIANRETASFEARAVTPGQFLEAMEQRGMVDFSVGGDKIRVDTTDFTRVNYDDILDEIKSLLC